MGYNKTRKFTYIWLDINSASLWDRMAANGRPLQVRRASKYDVTLSCCTCSVRPDKGYGTLYDTLLTHVVRNFFKAPVFVFSIFSQHRDAASSYNHSLWKTWTDLYCIFNTMAVDDLETQGAMASGLGVTKAPFVNFSVSKIFDLTKIYPLDYLNHIYIWWVSPQLSCGDTYQL